MPQITLILFRSEYSQNPVNSRTHSSGEPCAIRPCGGSSWRVEIGIPAVFGQPVDDSVPLIPAEAARNIPRYSPVPGRKAVIPSSWRRLLRSSSLTRRMVFVSAVLSSAACRLSQSRHSPPYAGCPARRWRKTALPRSGLGGESLSPEHDEIVVRPRATAVHAC